MKIRLHGINEGKTEVKQNTEAANIQDLAPEFYGEVQLNGVLTKYRNRFVFTGKATCNANLICDFCLEEFIKKIEASMEVNIIADTDMFFMQKEQKISDKDEIAVHPDDVYYNIALDVKDYLLLNIPMRRLCFNCQGKKFSDILPQFASKK